MNDFKSTQLLSEIMEEAKRLSQANGGTFTAERFIIALIDKIETTPQANKSPELLEAESLLNTVIGSPLETKIRLMAYITEERANAFLDELYIKKKLHAATAACGGANVISTAVLLDCIAKELSEPLKRAIAPNPAATGFDVGAKVGAPMGGIPTPQGSPMGNGAPQTNGKRTSIASGTGAKTEVSMLVTEAKRIRNELASHVYGQDNAINTFVSGYFQANMLSILDKNRKKPKATFLFAGPPGVGKTFLAETIAATLGLPFRRYDMSEYCDKEASIELLGSDAVYKDSKRGNLTEFVDDNPQCVLLFDEIEKAHISIIHQFLQILDAGRVRDSKTDKEIPFNDAIIILTTNAGRQLYQNSDMEDLSAVSRKVVIKALQKDVNPLTNMPFFPEAICSRFASGNVVMFNHMSVGNLHTIARKEIERQAKNLAAGSGIETSADEKVFSAMLFSEGASADARTIKSRAEAFFNDELYELLRLVESDKVKTGVTDIEKIEIKVDLTGANEEIASLFDINGEPTVLVIGDDKMVELCKRKLPGFEVYSAQSVDGVVGILKTKEIGFAMIDMSFGLTEEALTGLNIEDANSPARDCYKFLREQRSGLPVYLIESDALTFSDEEEITFKKQGTRGFLWVDEADDSLLVTANSIAQNLHQQLCMSKLATANKLVSFETAQVLSEDGKNAVITLFDFKTVVAIDSEDGESIVSNLSKPDVTFDDVIGATDAKKELRYFIEYLKNPKKYIGTGVKPPKGVLLYGPPGTGKTMLAKAMAKESNVTFIASEGNAFIKKYVGEGPEKVHELFKTARKYAPSILFIDEIDAIAKERQGNSSEGSASVEETLTAFLTEMDGFVSDTTRPVFVLAATNFEVDPGTAKSLDAALMRRFDRRVYIDLPDKEGRRKFIKKKISKNPAFVISDNMIENIVIRSTGMSLSALDSAMELALRSAIRDGGSKVTDEIFEEAFETFNNGEIKQWNPDSLQRVARHEAGHAFLNWYSGETPSYLTVVARGSHGGYMQHGDTEDKPIITKEELLARIRTSLGGRAAETVYYGEIDGISTGPSGDLYNATVRARHVLCTYGMDESFGLAAESTKGDMTPELRAAVNRILAEQLANAIRIISENKDKMDALVNALIDKNHLTGPEIEAVLGPAPKK